MQMKMDGIYNHLPHRTCSGTPPNEVVMHAGMHLVFPSLVAHQQLQIQKR